MIDIDNVNLDKRDGETDAEYCLRLMDYKKERLITNSEFFESVFDAELSEDEARKRFYGVDMLARLLPVRLEPIKLSTLPEIEKVKLRDARNAWRAMQRKVSRREQFDELLKDSVDNLEDIKMPPLNIPDNVDKDCALVVQLSDWHLGITVDNGWNKFNSDILNDRLSVFVGEIKNNIELYKPSEVVVLVQGDMISGNIHNTIRIQNRENVTEQIPMVAEKICETVMFVQGMVDKPVHTYFVAGNHERATPKKDDHINPENYMNLISLICKLRLEDEKPVVHYDEKYGIDIVAFDIMGQKAVAVHGDKDSFKTALNNISGMLKYVPDILFTAHHHHVHFEDLQRCRLVCNGSMVGMDDYSEKLRLNAYPSQNIVIVKRNKQVIPIPILVGE